MFAAYEVGSFAIAILALAFAAVWLNDRTNRAALYWCVAHVSLAVSSFTGFRYQETQNLGLVAISTVGTLVFLVFLWAANAALRQQDTAPKQWMTHGLALATGLLLAWLLGGQPWGRLYVFCLLVWSYGYSAYIFYRQLKLPWVAGAFAIRCLTYLPKLENFAPFADLPVASWATVLGWLSSVYLGTVLIHAAVQQSSRRLNQALRHLPHAIVAQRADNSVVFCNEAFLRLANAPNIQQLKKHMDNNPRALQLLQLIRFTATPIPLGNTLIREIDLCTPEGTSFPAEITISHFDDFGSAVRITQIRDLSERKNAEDARIRQLTTDELTGLPNRNYLEQQLQTSLTACKERGGQYALLLIDVDHFKQLNDAFGHRQGDVVLKALAQQLLAQCTTDELLVRFGGDEFALLTRASLAADPHSTWDSRAQAICQTLVQSIAKGDLSFRLGVSIGVTTVSATSSSAQDLLQQAELAMYEAKKRERGSHVFFDATMNDALTDALRLEGALHQAVPNGELTLHYQPIVVAGTAKLHKVEALLRWTSASLGPVSPAKFIPMAEQSTLIVELGNWVIHEAMRQRAVWQRQTTHPPIISINVSARQFAQENYVPMLLAATQHHGVQPSAIELELTEYTLVADNPAIALHLRALRECGFSISLDDFGTGYSSLSYLARFNLHTIKIDRSFITNLENDVRSQALVKAIIAMGHSLGLAVVAEGVETPAQQAFLVAEQCDYLQGYLFGRPAPASTFSEERS